MKKILIGGLVFFIILFIGGFFFIFTLNDGVDIPGGSNIDFFDVGPEKVDCVGEGPMRCLVVNGQYFYDNIGGFNYEEGYTYRIKVRIDDVENPPMDASSKKYTLIEIISKE